MSDKTTASAWRDVFKPSPRSVQFCSQCGAILTIPSDSDVVVCAVCGAQTPLTELESAPVVMHSLKIQQMREAQHPVQMMAPQDTGATVKEPCPKCNNPELKFHTAQLRSADEGQTVFYECAKCGYRFTVNN